MLRLVSYISLVIACIMLMLANITYAGRELTNLATLFGPCAFEDPNLNICVGNNLQILFLDWKQGALGSNALILLDPLAIKHVRIHRGNDFNAVLTKMLVHGASNALVEEATINKQTLMLNATITVPKLFFETIYQTRGNLFGLYVRDKGDLSFETGDVTLNLLIGLKVRLDGKATAIAVDNFSAMIKKIGYFRLGLVKGQNQLNEAIRSTLDSQWIALLEIAEPFVEEVLQAALEDRFKKIFGALPANSFIQNVPITEGFE